MEHWKLIGCDQCRRYTVVLFSLNIDFSLPGSFKACRVFVENGTPTQSIGSTILELLWLKLASVKLKNESQQGRRMRALIDPTGHEGGCQ